MVYINTKEIAYQERRKWLREKNKKEKRSWKFFVFKKKDYKLRNDIKVENFTLNTEQNHQLLYRLVKRLKPGEYFIYTKQCEDPKKIRIIKLSKDRIIYLDINKSATPFYLIWEEKYKLFLVQEIRWYKEKD